MTLINQCFEMLFIWGIFSYNFENEIFMYSFFEFNVIYWTLYEDLTVGIYIWLFAKEDILLVLSYHILHSKVKESENR